MSVAALIVGIDGWEQYTLPLMKSIERHEPGCRIIVIDNGSQMPYPAGTGIHHTEQLCYAAALNLAASKAGKADWLIALSNDVLCTGPFVKALAALGKKAIYGQVWTVARYTFAMGWGVIVPAAVWKKVGGWDENYLVSSWEDVDFSYQVGRAGYELVDWPLPFVHLDQRQRFSLPEFAGTHERNRAYFEAKHGFTQ